MLGRRAVSLSLVAIFIASVLAPSAAASEADDWTSFYANGPFEDAGWSDCPSPIHVSVDTSDLKPKQRRKAKIALRAALGAWNSANVVRFEFGGEVPVTFNKSNGVSTPTDGIARDRWIYLTIVKGQYHPTHDTSVVGLGEPLRVDQETDIILEGAAAFQAQYVNSSSVRDVWRLFTHELGHVFGLGHSSSSRDVMYAILGKQSKLGSGDLAGIRAILKPCPATAPSAAPTS